MHIIIALIGGIVSLLILNNKLKQLGVDIGWLNPFSWAHRRRWRKKYGTDPAFTLKTPLEVAAGLSYVAAKCSGDISIEEKNLLLELFQNSFHLPQQKATELLSSCAFLIKDEDTVFNKVPLFIEASLNQFTLEQKHSTLEMLNRVINISNSPNDKQLSLVSKVSEAFQLTPPKNNQWH